MNTNEARTNFNIIRNQYEVQIEKNNNCVYNRINYTVDQSRYGNK